MNAGSAWFVGRRRQAGHVAAATAIGTCVRAEGVTGSDEEGAFLLGEAAGRDCLARSRRSASDLEMLILSSSSRHAPRDESIRLEPALGTSIARALGAPSAVSVDVAHSDAGMLTGVLMLQSFIARGTVRCGLVVAAECLSRLRLPPAGPRESAVLVDAGAAVLVERSEPGREGIVGAGFTDGADLGYALGQCGVRPGDIDWLFCDGDATAVTGAREHPRNVVITGERGYSASATPFVALARCLVGGRVRSGDKVALASSAPGQLGLVVLAVEDLVGSHGRAH
jgi:3-oxoacyl-[acyl-carrier-protein] synthase III